MASASVAIAPQTHYHHADIMQDAQSGDKSRSPESGRSPPKMVVIKKESSPEPTRHRPSKLNLSKTTGSNHVVGQATPRTALTMREVGMACLSPGLNVTDDAMREQLERSMGVRDQQRQIIEGRLQRHVHTSTKDDHGEPSAGFSASRGGKRKPPAGLSIVAPHHNQFANERVIHSAPLNQSFTVRRSLAESRLAGMSSNRLPPIADVVFGPDMGGERENERERERDRERERGAVSSQMRHTEQRSFFPPPIPNTNRPDYPSPMQLDKPDRQERSSYKSAEEAVAGLTGGREDLLPRIVHYGGHQPPTPPSPNPGALGHNSKRISSLGQSSMKTKTTTLTLPASSHDVSAGGPNKRRRTRNDFDRDDSTGSENDAEAAEAKRRKKERFLALCSEAWDLLHS